MKISRRNKLEKLAKQMLEIIEDDKIEENVRLAIEQREYEMGEYRRDFDVIAVGRSKKQQERIKCVRDIVKELERERGVAQYDEIIERAEHLGFEKDHADAEITKLVQEAAIFEPVRYSRNYRTTQT